MTALEQAQQMRTDAIQLLLTERQHIDDALSQLGHDGKDAPRARKCGKCDQPGHTSRTCPTEKPPSSDE